MYNRQTLEEIQPNDLYDDNRPAIWPDSPIPGEPVDYVLVGEAPGKMEVKKGQVFIGPAGELLRDLLAEAGITRFHLTNASLYRPTVGSEDAPPNAGVIKAERPRVHLEISMLGPKAIVAMGGTAWYSVLGDVPRLRGMVRYLTIHGREYPVYLTWHPAAILRNHDYYRDVVEDLDRASKLILPVRAQVPQWSELGQLSGEVIAVDTEATSPHSGTANLRCVTVSDGQKVAKATIPELDKFLVVEGKGRRIVGHNVLGDEVLLRLAGSSIRFTDDTLLKHLSQDERKGSHKLKALAPSKAGIDTGIDWIWPYTHAEGDEDDGESNTWANIPDGTLEEYCGQDSLVTHKLASALEATSDERTNHIYSFLTRAQRAFTEGMYAGVSIDNDLLERRTTEQRDKVTALAGELNFNPESHKQTLAALRGAGYKIRSAARDVLEGLKGPLPTKILEYRGEAKLLKAFLNPLPQWQSPGDRRVRPTYKIHGTATGRTSCGDPNLQQVPPELRHLFIAAPGHTFIGWDYKVHEVRGLAYYSRDARLLEFLEDEQADPHQLIADTVGLPRQTAKHSLFGVAYGASPGKLVRQHGISIKEAEHAFVEIKNLFPELDSWKEAVYDEVYNLGYVETPYGRRRYFPYMDEKNRARIERQAVNFKVQSFCGDVALESAIAVYEELGYPPIIFVHDFNLIEVPDDKVDKVRGDCEEVAGAIYPNQHVRFVPEVKIGKTWGNLQQYDIEEGEVNE